MSADKLYTRLVRANDGAWSTAYGRFVIKSALQPVFRISHGGILELDGLQGLIRPQKDGDSFSPGEFFPLVDAASRPDLESLMRTIHILNAGRLKRRAISVFVNFAPQLYPHEHELQHEIDRLRLAAHEAHFTPRQIVLELSGREGAFRGALDYYVGRLRDSGFTIALGDFGAGDMDSDRAAELKPDFIKFDSPWVRDYMANPAGFALLRVIVRNFRENGMQPIFDRLEEAWQVEFCRSLGVPLIQGYALARPQLAPTDFNDRFPEDPVAQAVAAVARHRTGPTEKDPISLLAPNRHHHPARAFGRRPA